MNEQIVVTLPDKHVLLVSDKEHWLSSVRHHYRFPLATQATKPLPSLSHRHSSLLKHLGVGYQLNYIPIKCLEYTTLEGQ